MDGDGVITVPLSTSRSTGRLVMSPPVARLLMDRLKSTFDERRQSARDRVRELHTPDGDMDSSHADTYCAHDGEHWPCSTIVATGEMEV